MTDEEARAILKDHGEQPPERGKLAAHWHEAADAMAAAAITGAADPGPPDRSGAAAPSGDGADSAGDATPPLDGQTIGAERRPTRPRARPRSRRGGGAGLRDRLWGSESQKRSQNRKPPRPRRDRMPVDKLCASFWRGAGKAAAYISMPLSRTIDLQAPFAGVVLEDTVRGTFVDTLLQPVARSADRGRNVVGLFGPPMIVMALEAAKGLPEDQRQMRAAFLLPMLEESLIVCHKIAGERAAEVAERAEEDAPLRQAVRMEIAMIFAGPPSATPEGADQAAGQ